ncbi:MAG: hypothetical protein PHS44_01010 [Candidatus Dojkabacteria bacterium]|nr:hypothetical protein [Candidatus Dojkabacteria bacterium]
MKKVVIGFRGKELIKFESARQAGIYLLDLLLKLGILALIAGNPLAHEFIDASSNELAGYTGIYLGSIFCWGLLFIRSIVVGKGAFGKTKFDLGFMSVLFFLLLGVLFAKDRVVGVFGRFGTWSYSIITFLSVSVIYYVTTIVFKYSRGVKWLSLGFILSLLIGGVYNLILLSSDESSPSLEYLRYAVVSIPLAIGTLFILRRNYLKIASGLVVFFNIVLVGLYSNYLRGAMFILSVGVLSLFVLFYFSFWIRNSSLIINFVKKIVTNIKNAKRILSEGKREVLILLMMIFMAGWIMGFGIFSISYYQENIGPYVSSWVREDVHKMQGIQMWLVGGNDLSEEFSSLEVLNFLGNYGLLGAVSMLMLFLAGVFYSAKLTLRLLYQGSFRNIILLSGLFITVTATLVNFMISRFSPMTYLLFLVVFSLLAIIDDIFNKRELYALVKPDKKWGKNQLIFKTGVSIAVFALFVAGMLGILDGLDKGLLG